MNQDDERDDIDDDRPRQGRPRRGATDMPPQSNPAATASLVLGVLALCGGIMSLPAIICAVIGLTKAKSRGGKGMGMAIAGLVLSLLGVVVALPLLLFALLMPAMGKVREAAARTTSANNMKQISLGQFTYSDMHNKFAGPSANGQTGPMNERLSWRFDILPYIEQQNLYSAMDAKGKWNSSRNIQYSSTSIKTFGHPSDLNDNQTRYRVFYNGGAIFDESRPARITAITDGTSNTILAVEATDRVPWAQCNEFEFSKSQPLPALGLPDANGFQVTYADGSVRFIRKTINPEVLKGAIHASDNLYGAE